MLLWAWNLRLPQDKTSKRGSYCRSSICPLIRKSLFLQHARISLIIISPFRFRSIRITSSKLIMIRVTVWYLIGTTNQAYCAHSPKLWLENWIKPRSKSASATLSPRFAQDCAFSLAIAHTSALYPSIAGTEEGRDASIQYYTKGN